MKTAHPTYEPRTVVRLFVTVAAVVVAALAASASSAAPVAPAFALRTTCTDLSLLTATTARPALVTRTLSTSRRTWSYGWPVKPFDRQHPVRAFFDDPRIGSHGGASFHFGIDIAVPDGTPVYAVEAGRVWYGNGESLAVVASDWSHSFGYWHVVPAVRNHTYVAQHQLIAHVATTWGHVHFAERRHDVYLNPLRNGGIGPYVDRTAPVVDDIGFDGAALVAAAHDIPDPQVPGTWRNEPVTPALLRFRVDGGNWRTAADFRSTLLPVTAFASVYGDRTRQNHERRPGQYCFGLDRDAGPSSIVVEVEVSDTAGNRAVYAATVRRDAAM